MLANSPAPPATAALFAELQDLKRITPAHLPHSIATELFRRGWQRLINDEDAERVAYDVTLRALLSILFPGADGRLFATAGIEKEEVEVILRRALERSAQNRISQETYGRLSENLPALAEEYARWPEHAPVDLPEPLDTLCRQPRAGATHPERPRLLLLPPEMHSDHCLMTAVFAVLKCEEYGAEVGTVFLCALAHHLHNAFLPDCGYAGEICLGDHLTDVIDNCRQAAIDRLPAHLRPRTKEALRHHETIDSPEGKAVSAGDVLDRVLDVKWRTRAAAVTDRDILGELDLVHPGPLKDFQTELLAETELWRG